MLRLTFLASAAVCVGVYAGHIVQSAMSRGTATVDFAADEIVTMVNPRFSGRDSSGAAYVITADEARRRRQDDSIVDLINPVLNDAAGGQVRAPSGMYHRQAGIMELYQDVQITDPTGYSFKTAGARIHVAESRVEGLSPLQGRGPLGDVRADSFEILDGGNRSVLEGNTHIVIYPSKRDMSDIDAAETDIETVKETSGRIEN
jgi:lipopolysaccharide export system protein LptC